MKFRFWKFSSLILAVVLFATGCSFSDPAAKDPKTAVAAYIDYLGKGDYKSAVNLLNNEAKQETNKDKFIKAKNQLISLYGQDAFAKVEVNVVSSSDNQAKALVKIGNMAGSEDLTFNLVKAGDEWRIGK